MKDTLAKKGKNLLRFHEAIVVALINQPNRTATFRELAEIIEKRNLFTIRKGKTPLSIQIMVRTTKSKGAYRHLFEDVGAGYISLRDSYKDFLIQLSLSLDAILENHGQLYRLASKEIRVKDELIGVFRSINLAVPDIICISTKEKSGEKKFIYVLERDLQGNQTVGVYSINKNMEQIANIFDPLQHYLAMVSDSSLVNVSFFNLVAEKRLEPLNEIWAKKYMIDFKFSTSPAARKYYERFIYIQESYQKRISFEKSILDWKSNNQLP